MALQGPHQDGNDSILEILEGAFSSVTLEEVAFSAAGESEGVKVSYEATGKPVICTGGSKFLDVEAAEKAIAQLEAPDTVGTGRRGMPDEPLLPASIKGTQQTLLALVLVPPPMPSAEPAPHVAREPRHLSTRARGAEREGRSTAVSDRLLCGVLVPNLQRAAMKVVKNRNLRTSSMSTSSSTS